MADQLATAEDLRTLLGEDVTALPDAEANLLLEMATGAVQAAAGQSLVAGTSTVTLVGTVDGWLDLPELPVTTVSEVLFGGVAISDYRVFGARLWRASGWAMSPYEPYAVTVTYSHGYAADAAELQLAKSATLVVAGQLFSNPTSTSGYMIDDYQERGGVQSGDLSGLIPARLQKSLRAKYGPRARLVRFG